MNHYDYTPELEHVVSEAIAAQQPLQLVGGDTKSFYGRPAFGERVSMKRHTGVIHYEPTELVLTAHSGTPLHVIETTLAEHNQMLAFEPPHFGEDATLGGTIACGLSGPRRPYSGAARDYVLGMRIMNGKGEVLRFGGEVMKNVAGYDVARLMTGAMGTLGIILDVSLKVVPRPAVEITLVQEHDSATTAIRSMNQIATQPHSLSAACHWQGKTYLRLCGTERAVMASARAIGGEQFHDAANFWHDVREQRHSFFSNTRPLWRLSLPPATAALDRSEDMFLDWGGAQRWHYSEHGEALQTLVALHGGHASLFRSGERRDEVFAPLSAPLKRLHMEMKLAFDPHCIFNQGRMYSSY